MNLLILLSIILSVLLGVSHAVDLALFVDPETGLCLTGSVWLRYAALAVAVLAAVLAGRTGKPEPKCLCGPCKPSGTVAVLGGVLMAAAGAAKIILGSAPLAKGVWGALAICCGGWLAAVGRSWLQKDWKRPTGSLTEAVLGSAIFYWCVLTRFMENSSSWHRVSPTAAVWQMLAALLFLSTLCRALYLPETANGKTLCASGLAAFALCLCWALPETVQQMKNGLTALPEVLFGLGLCCVGTLGGLCAWRVAAAQPEKATPHSKTPRHSVG